MREAAVGNALSPTVGSRVGGTISADVDNDLSLCLELMSATRRSSSQTFRRQVMQTAVDEDRQFVLDTLWYSQPVQVAKKWRYVLEPPFREYQTCSSVQDRLQLVEHVAW